MTAAMVVRWESEFESGVGENAEGAESRNEERRVGCRRESNEVGKVELCDIDDETSGAEVEVDAKGISSVSNPNSALPFDSKASENSSTYSASVYVDEFKQEADRGWLGVEVNPSTNSEYCRGLANEVERYHGFDCESSESKSTASVGESAALRNDDSVVRIARRDCHSTRPSVSVNQQLRETKLTDGERSALEALV
jgi:hypothetical protein